MQDPIKLEPKEDGNQKQFLFVTLIRRNNKLRLTSFDLRRH